MAPNAGDPPPEVTDSIRCPSRVGLEGCALEFLLLRGFPPPLSLLDLFLSRSNFRKPESKGPVDSIPSSNNSCLPMNQPGR